MAEYWKNGKKYEMPDITPEELAKIQADQEAEEREYWESVLYGAAVSAEIHKKHDIDAELALQRQKDEKPEEYAEYYAYCEQCKAYVREQFAKYGRLI